ncbi:GNAT family N-acetyltransferase [Flocculibacter collagenilyticus]|uniref:GNAT family N-acetyltransferase n=1 Tax=Flocculibacter collagenilyticus TaxID=2744479 RepID=UPI0018F5B4CB|nr:GNAT family N-acetyltransferase [Flocculibacter collagenilyticus]
MSNTTIRLATPEDSSAIADVMYDAVRNGKSQYSEEHRKAWVPKRRSGSEWEQRLNSQYIYIAESNNQVLGFMSLDNNGYIDFVFIRPAAQGTGVFGKLLKAVESHAHKLKQNRLWVHASLMAEPAFSRKGFSIIKKEVVNIGDFSFERLEMEKDL